MSKSIFKIHLSAEPEKVLSFKVVCGSLTFKSSKSIRFSKLDLGFRHNLLPHIGLIK